MPSSDYLEYLKSSMLETMAIIFLFNLQCQICEDIPEELDVDVPGLSERPINILIPRLLQVIWVSENLIIS